MSTCTFQASQSSGGRVSDTNFSATESEITVEWFSACKANGELFLKSSFWTSDEDVEKKVVENLQNDLIKSH